ncbi:cyclin-dependent kinase inhibitor 3 family protein [Deinococcus arenicola]|uniref:Cyclin-dependent kinase inhibitor 3 family protein n=1 Tax=Deinococcus arenicola TaxID=2994950 RepID=A0ABU4DQW2_9DEIO|nr:cyclin-dependent kinase inhibitor 3 family protein [Deinococcus sp. ZS9-10]MDV6374817.1 cyclin-dependent kinase inhibitor 3 family protein [Deinococcus sp. ZS9-10]
MSHSPQTESPIRVDWIPTGLWPGRLGLTFAPGKKGGSVYQPGLTHDRDVYTDMQTLAADGVNVLAPLIEDFEFDLLGMDGYHAAAELNNLDVRPFAIRDQHAPGKRADFAAFVDELMTELLDGLGVVVHCRGGLGRAGMAAACLLVQGGMTADAAIGLVRQTRSQDAIETASQEQYVHEFADFTPV